MSRTPLSWLKKIAAQGHLSMNENLHAAWQSPSNIAIVKYWGKKNGQYPLTPSLSMTLDRAVTQTHVDAMIDAPEKGLVSVNGNHDHPFLPKLQQLYEWMAGEIPVLKNITLTVTTENSFPHSTGIASSASGISAFTLCLLTITKEILNAGIQWMN